MVVKREVACACQQPTIFIIWLKEHAIDVLQVAVVRHNWAVTPVKTGHFVKFIQTLRQITAIANVWKVPS